MPEKPTLAEVIRATIESRLDELHTTIPGRVKKYDATTQRADIEILVRRATPSADDDGSVVLEDPPVIPNVQVEWPFAGGFYFHLPLAVGDEGRLSFSESATAQAQETGEPSAPGDLRRHSLGYPTFFPCPISKGKKLPDAPTGHGVIVVAAGKFLRITEAGASGDFVALKGAFDALQVAFDAHVHPTGVGPSGPTASVIGPKPSSSSLKA